jgi:hypothetical protein
LGVDEDVLSLAGNTLAGEGTRGGATTLSVAMGTSLSSRAAGLEKRGRGKKEEGRDDQ